MSVLFQLLVELAIIGATLVVLMLAIGIIRLTVLFVGMIFPGVKVCSNCGCATLQPIYSPSCHFATLPEDSSQ